MKRIVILCCIVNALLGAYTSYAQDRNIDSLQRLLVKASSVKEEISLLNAIAEQLIYTKPKEGVDYVTKAAKLAKEHNLPLQVAHCITTLANIQSNMSQYDEAYQNLQKALKLYTQQKSIFGQIRVYYFMGFRESLLGNEQAALVQYKKALEVANHKKASERTSKEAMLIGNVFNGMGISYDVLGKPKKSANHYETALKIFKEQRIEGRQMVIYNNLSIVYRALGNIELAMESCQKGLILAKKLKQQQIEAALYGNIAMIYQKQGEYQQSLELYHKALRLSLKHGNREGIPIDYQNIGNVYLLDKKYDDAQASYEKALEYAKKVSDTKIEVDLWINIANLHEEKKEYDQALKMYNKVLDYYTRKKLDRNKGYVLKGIGDVYLAQGKDVKAEELYTKAYQLTIKMGFKESQLVVANSLAKALIKLKKYQEAKKYSLIALELAQKIKSKQEAAKSYFNLYQLNAGTNDHQQALKYYRQYHLTKDSLDNIAKAKQLSLLRIRHKVGEQEKELQKKNTAVGLLKQGNERKQQLIFWLLVSVGVSIAFIVVWQKLIRGRFMKLKKVQKQLFDEQLNKKEIQQLLLEEQLQRKEVQQQLLEEQLQRKTIEEQVLQEQLKQDQLNQQQLRVNLEDRNHELTKQALYIVQKRELLNEIKGHIDTVIAHSEGGTVKQLNKILRLIKTELGKNEEWKNFTQTFELAHPKFFVQLKESYPTLTPHEIKLCALLRLNFNTKELALILNIAIDSANKARFRLRKKLGLSDENLNEFLMNF